MKAYITEGYNYPDEVKKLFNEYTDMLIEGDSEFREYLEIQKYDKELENLQSKYGLPYGRLHLLMVNGKVAGCIALRKIDNENCELKRLYIRPEFRGKNPGEMLCKKVIAEAGEIGYKYMLLDTLPFLKTALKLYKKLGFYEINCYNDSPMKSSVYMRLDLDKNES